MSNDQLIGGGGDRAVTNHRQERGKLRQGYSHSPKLNGD
jgi:hypothetical protein